MPSNEPQTRWWEAYALRYFVGMALGGFAVHYLAAKGGLHWLPQLPKIDSETEIKNLGTWLALYGVLGLAYCYIASAPMLVFHSTRMSIRRVCKPCSTFGIVCVGSIAYLFLLTKTSLNKKEAFACILFGALLFLQLTLIISSKKRQGRIYKLNRFLIFYKKLARERNLAEKNLIPSYMHMREHGNAFANFILVGILTIILAAAPTDYVAYVLVLWVAPGAYCWNLANQLEAMLASGNMRAVEKTSSNGGQEPSKKD